MEQFQAMIPKDTKKILITTDYITLLGGIETHVQTIAKVLRLQGYEVEIFGWDIPKGSWTKALRVAGLLYSLFNITAALRARKIIQNFKPDVIWCHSLSRFLGPLVAATITKSRAFSMITYHDLGLLTPFPSRIESEDMIPQHP